MKKFFAIALLVIMMVSLLTACGKFECELCKEEKSGKKHKEEVLGQEVVICDECHDGLEALKDAASELMSDLSNY